MKKTQHTKKIDNPEQSCFAYKGKGYRYYIYGLVILIVALLAIGGLKKQEVSFPEMAMNAVKAKVLQIHFDNTDKKAEVEGANVYRYQEFQISITQGKHKGETYWMRNTVETADIYNIVVKEGENILVSITEDEEGTIENLHLYDKQRDVQLYILIAIFILLILIIGGKQGVKSILTLVFTGIMIVQVLLPLILSGWDPVLTAILVSGIVTGVTLTVIGGFSQKTLTAILGTLGGVFVAGVIALIVGNYSQITGLANEDTQSMIYFLNYPDMDFKGILFAGIIIGALGAVMDVSMSIASAMHEIIEIKPDIKTKELIKSGMNIGRDIMGSMSNTLILAYTGGAMELILLFMATKTPWSEVINLDMVAAEVIRAIAGSIGLAATIPLTVLIFIAVRNKR